MHSPEKGIPSRVQPPHPTRLVDFALVLNLRPQRVDQSIARHLFEIPSLPLLSISPLAFPHLALPVLDLGFFDAH